MMTRGDGGVDFSDVDAEDKLFSELLGVLRSIQIAELSANSKGTSDRTHEGSLWDIENLHASGSSDSVERRSLVEAFSKALSDFEAVAQPDAGPRLDAHICTALEALTVCLNAALGLESAHVGGLMALLADASRELTWRARFGKIIKLQQSTGEETISRRFPTNSILTIAIEFIHGDFERFSVDVLRNALRIVANCCADNDANRKTVVDRDGVTYLMSLTSQRVEPDLVIPTIFNICVDYEYPDGEELTLSGESAPGKATSVEFDGVNPAQRQLGAFSAHGGAFHALLGLVDVLVYQERLPFLAELIQMASTCATTDLSSLKSLLSVRESTHEKQMDCFEELLAGPGLRLSTYNTACRVSICHTLINILEHDEAKRSLISNNHIQKFVNVGYEEDSASLRSQADFEEDPDARADLLKCRKAILKMLYSICALPDFAVAYPLDSTLVQFCIATLRNPRMPSREYDRDPSRRVFACVILASLTISEDVAKAFVEDVKLHKTLSELLQNDREPDLYYPAIALISRLALPSCNKTTMVQDGLLGALQHIFTMDSVQNVQVEAVTAIRRLIAGSPQSLAEISYKAGHVAPDQSANESELASILGLFRRTDHASVKQEIGRLMIDICRTLWTSAKERPELGEEGFVLATGEAGDTFAQAIAFVIVHAEGSGLRAEGWLGFAMMSVWERGRSLIAACFDSQEILEEVKRAASSGGGPSFQNLRLVLVKMALVPKQFFSTETRSVLEKAASSVGLDLVWPDLQS